MSKIDPIPGFLDILAQICPDLLSRSHPVDVHLNEVGQNSAVLILDETWVVRFPYYEVSLREMRREAALLAALYTHPSAQQLPISVPRPVYQHLDAAPGEAFLAHRMLPGAPLWSQTWANISGEMVRHRVIEQLTGFLYVLHSIPVDERLPHDLPRVDTMQEWSDIYQRMRDKLFEHMRPDARTQVTAHFETYLDGPHWASWAPTLKHGDCGPSNILYDSAQEQLGGIIDFGGAGLGDPAYDFAGLLSGYGEVFVRQMAAHYPGLEAFWPRIRFYCGTFALIEALFGVENNDPEAFQAGIAEYV